MGDDSYSADAISVNGEACSALNSMSQHSNHFQSNPCHVAIIMDGNGRWANERGLPRLAGHAHGVEAVRRVLEFGVKSGIKFITLYAFSSENWSRPEQEVGGLMELFAKYLHSEQETFMREGIRLIAIGDRTKLPKEVVIKLEECEKITSINQKLTLILAVSYGARDEIVRAAQKIADQVKNNNLNIGLITEEVFSKNLDTTGIPDPDLLIRTSGESRISNFLLWQLAYTEIVVTKVLWPDFSAKEFEECLIEYSKRNRRFGRTEYLKGSDMTSTSEDKSAEANSVLGGV